MNMKNSIKLLILSLLVTLPLSAQPHQIGIAAHRGFWKCEAAHDAQNSIASLREAQEKGLWGSECDIHLTLDGEIVVHHDGAVDGISIHKNPYSAISSCRLSNAECIPTFDAYLEQTASCPTTVLVIELKHFAVTAPALAALKKHGLYDPSRVMFISFDYDACKKVAQEAPEFTNQYLTGDKSPAELKADGINGLDYHYSVYFKHPEWVTKAHELGMSVNVWTVDDEEDIRKCVELGVDCITTNEPLKTREILGENEAVLVSDDFFCTPACRRSLAPTSL